MQMNCFQHGEFEGASCPVCTPKKPRRDRREQICHDTVESIRKMLLRQGIDTETARDPVAVGFGLAEILDMHVRQLHSMGACRMEDWVQQLYENDAALDQKGTE